MEVGPTTDNQGEAPRSAEAPPAEEEGHREAVDAESSADISNKVDRLLEELREVT
jgi:hypothetical protein